MSKENTSAASPRSDRRASQAATRDRLTTSARHLIVRQSIPALSLRQLCADAGLTQGAFYSNFADKKDLVIAVMEQHLAERHGQLAQLALLLRYAGAEETFAALSAWLGGLDDRHEWAVIAGELRLYAHRDPTFSDKLRSAEARSLAGFASLIDDLARRLDLQPVLPTPALAQMLFDVWYAAVLRDPGGNQPGTVFVEVLRKMLPASQRARRSGAPT